MMECIFLRTMSSQEFVWVKNILSSVKMDLSITTVFVKCEWV